MKIIGFVVFAFFTSQFGFSQGGANKDSVLILFKVMRQEEMIKQAFEAVSKSITASYKTSLADPKYKEITQEFLNKSTQRRIEMTNKILNEDLVFIYMKHYSQSEIVGLLKFYRSPLGQKMLDTAPLINQEYMQVYMTKYSPEYQNGIREDAQNMMKEMQANEK